MKTHISIKKIILFFALTFGYFFASAEIMTATNSKNNHNSSNNSNIIITNNLYSQSRLHENSNLFVEKLFQRAILATRNLTKNTLLNGTEQQEGFCKLLKESILTESIIPYLAGKELWETSSEKQKLEFSEITFTNLAIYLSIIFQNSDKIEDPTFNIDNQNTTEQSIFVNVSIPYYNSKVLIQLVPVGIDGVKMIDSYNRGVSSMRLKQADFEAAADGSIDLLISKIKTANKKSGYGECQLEKKK